jgi:hypothetical protein
MNSSKRIRPQASLVIAQIILEILFMIFGWEVAIELYPPKGNNWMWGQEVVFSLLVFAVIVIFGFLLSYFTATKTKWLVVIQLLLMMVYLSMNFDIRPLRNTFLLLSLAPILLFRNQLLELIERTLFRN